MEYFDVYNDKKEKTGKILPRKNSFLKEGEYQLIVLGIVERTVHREILEETGLDISAAEGGLIYTYKNVDLARGDNYFVDMYHFRMDFNDDDVHPQESETEGYAIVPFSKIEKLGREGHFLHYERILQGFAAENYPIQD